MPNNIVALRMIDALKAKQKPPTDLKKGCSFRMELIAIEAASGYNDDMRKGFERALILIASMDQHLQRRGSMRSTPRCRGVLLV